MKKQFNKILFLLIALALTGCSGKSNIPEGGKGAARHPLNVVQAGAAPAKEEDKAEREVYNYEAKSRDPFFSLIQLAKEKPRRKKGATPVENFDISEIKLNAIVWDSSHYYALMTLPDNKSYTVKKGMALGLYGGRVEDITKNSVLIREQIKDYRGQLKTKDTTLKLRKEGE